MKILVLIKEVPVVTDIKIDRETLTIDRSGAGKMMNASDRHAIEAALTTAKEAGGGTVTAMTMGPESSESILRDAIGLGCTDAIRITDDAFAGADTLVTAYILQAAIQKTGPYDAIFTGARSVDGETGQIPGKLAALLSCGLITNAASIEADEKGITSERKAGSGYEKMRAEFPLVCSVTEDANTVRNMGIKGRTAMKKAEIPVFTNADLALTNEQLKSASRITGLVPPAAESVGTMLTGSDDLESAEKLLQTLLEKQYI